MGEWDTKLVGSRTRATDTKTFTFERPADLTYAPGQFFFVMLRDEVSRPIEHHFSFSSSPTEAVVEFTTRMTGSTFKTRMDALSPGDTVHIAGPEGVFVLAPEMRKVALICGGIGITPARSMVTWAADSKANVDITVVHGDRDERSCAFREEFMQLDSNRIRVVTVLSHPEAEWTGRRGHVDADLVRSEIADWQERHFFVSGAPQMVEGVVRMLAGEVGVSTTKIMSEHFPGYASASGTG